MKAFVLSTEKQLPTYEEVAKPVAGADEVVVRVAAAALNHRDVWITQGMYPGIRVGTILGSDGAGYVGERAVVINPNIGWGTNEHVQDNKYQILGMPCNGTFAEYIRLGADRVEDKPAHLSMEEAGALPLGGLTAYRALFTKCQVKAGDRVLISGVGGGVALFACQFAIAAGAEVYVTSSSQEKIDRAIALGAKGGYRYTEEGWQKRFTAEVGGVDAIVDSAAGDGFADLLKLCRPGARVCFYGGTRGKMNKLNPQLIFWKQLTILGSTMGSDSEFREMLTFVTQHQIKPVVDQVFSLSDGQAAFQRMADGLQFGKLVLKVEK